MSGAAPEEAGCEHIVTWVLEVSFGRLTDLHFIYSLVC
jgi:hypothetical protein